MLVEVRLLRKFFVAIEAVLKRTCKGLLLRVDSRVIVEVVPLLKE